MTANSLSNDAILTDMSDDLNSECADFSPKQPKKMPQKQIKKHRVVLDGVLLLDKPQGITSNQALQKVKRRFNAQKAGHAGTLDPMATGLLPICFGEAAKFSTQLLDADKTYEFTCQLGQSTHTGDKEGNVIAQAGIPQLSRDCLNSVFKTFIGDISQVPPMVSALWHNGERLYDLAREGIEIERQARALTIYELELLGFTNTTFSAKVKCSKGTYVRVLAEDIAKALGSLGHLIMLRRLEIHPFKLPNMLSLEDILDESKPLSDLVPHLLKIEVAIMDLPEIILDEAHKVRFLNGQRIPMNTILSHHLYRIYDAFGNFLGTGHPHTAYILGPKRLKAI